MKRAARLGTLFQLSYLVSLRVALERVKGKDLTTPGEYLRKKSGGIATLEALQTNVEKLGEKYGERAFRHFKNVDMRVLKE